MMANKMGSQKNISSVGKRIPTFVFMVFFLMACLIKINAATPDFAFPKKIIQESDTMIRKYKMEGNDLMVFRWVINNLVAMSLSEQNPLSGQINFIDTVTDNFSGKWKSLSLLLKAQLLFQNYNIDPYKYDARKLPLDLPLPSDPLEWSGDMYRIKILELVDNATLGLTNLSDENIRAFSIILTNTEEAGKVGMTLPDFIALKGESLLADFSKISSDPTIPFYPNREEETPRGKCREKALRLLDGIIELKSQNKSVIKALAMKRKRELMNYYQQEPYLEKCQEDLKGTEGEGLILYELWRNFSGGNFTLYQPIKSWLENFPSGYGNEELRNVVEEMTIEKVNTEFPSVSLADRQIKGKVEVENLTFGYLLVYKLNKEEYDNYGNFKPKKFSSNKKPVAVIPFEHPGDRPFKYEEKITLPILPQGVYVVIPSKTEILSKDWNSTNFAQYYSTFRVSDITIMATSNSNEKDSGKIYVLKGNDGAPLEGALVNYYKGDSLKPIGSVTTNKEGWVKIPEGFYRIEAKYGKNEAVREVGINYYPEDTLGIPHISILSDLAIYHPGDTVKFSLVGWEQNGYGNTLITDSGVNIILRDASYTEAGKLSLKLNSEGRASGEIIIPEGRLLGNYCLIAELEGKPGLNAGIVSFSVEEYKLPEFMVTLERKSSEEKDVIIFEGTALTYTGLPISESEGEIKIEYLPWRPWFNFSNASFSEKISTDRDGKFLVSLPLKNLWGTQFENGRYKITASVTSKAGYTAISSPDIFFIGKGISLNPIIKDKIEIDSEIISLCVTARDMADLPVKTEIKYTITDLNDTTNIYKGKFMSPVLELPSKDFKSGKYRFEFFAEGLDNPVSVETVLWRKSDKMTPYPTVLWVPETTYYYGEGENDIEITFRSSYPEWILYILSDGEKELGREWIKPDDKLSFKKIDIPEGQPTLFINLTGIYNLESSSGEIKVIPKKALEKMEIETISFRDNITAGETENWTFRFKSGEKLLENVYAFGVMTDKALNAIRDFRWNLGIYQKNIFNSIRTNIPGIYNVNSYKVFTGYSIRSGIKDLMPDWETYGYSMVDYMFGRVNSRRMYKSSALNVMATKDSAGMIEEAVMEMADYEKPVDAGLTTGEVESKTSDIELRPVEMPVAFFMPDLSTNENGELTVSFVVPNYNTTWQFQLAAYTKNLENATIVQDAVSNKALMVKSNLPKFLRTGDSVEFPTTIYNNSSEPITVSSKIEILNPNNGEILSSKEFNHENVGSSETVVSSLYFEIPSDVSMIAVRAIATSGSVTDGEQGFIPVLPASIPIIESKTFYADSNQEIIELKLPDYKKNANVTLKYCDNPLWEILLSLPALQEKEDASSLSLGKQLYAMILASYIINNNPEIEENLKNIFDSQDSTLTLSPLQKEADLKITSLQTTPWINDASMETSRIRSLINYSKKSEVEAIISGLTANLQNLQNSDGGWSWIKGMKSSPFITSGILKVFSYLKAERILPADLEKMALKGLKYYDNYLINGYSKYGRINTIQMIEYLRTRNKFGIKSDKTFRKIETETLDSVSRSWKYLNLTEKAEVGLVMTDYSDRKGLAEIISQSLGEFLGKKFTPATGSLLLELFNKTGETTSLEKTREKLFLEKETSDWGNDLMTVGLINSLLSVTSKKSVNTKSPEIFLNGEKLILPESQKLTGNFTIKLDKKNLKNGKLEIHRQKGVPAWGGVVAQYLSPIEDVKKVDLENLSVDKKLYVYNSNGTLKETTRIKKGDKVRVVINLFSGKDMDYVVIKDGISSTLQPDGNLSGMTEKDGIFLYQEFGFSNVSFFLEHLPAGKYVIGYDCHVEREGSYALSPTEVQCLYFPAEVAHSAGESIKVSSAER